MIKREFKLDEVVLDLIVFFSIIPDIGIKVPTFGFVWTAYRFFVAVCFFYVLSTKRDLISFSRRRLLSRWMLFSVIWLAYGAVQLFISKYSDAHSGMLELLSIFNGLLVCWILKETVHTQADIDRACRMLYHILALLVVMGLVEILTGFHWITSAFHDEGSTIAGYVNTHLATGFMYNMNDFSALLSCLSPVLIDKRHGFARWLILLGIVVINLINDATLCNLAIFSFFGYDYFIINGGQKRFARAKRAFFILAMAVFVTLLFYQGNGLVERTDTIGALARQVFNARNATGSMYMRVNIYRDGLNAWLHEGVLGMGPSSFMNYFQEHASISNLVNPHSLLLEILSQYGIIIFIGFVSLLARMMIVAIARFRRGSASLGSRKQVYLVAIGFLVIYLLASFAPSSFLGYSYQWLIVGLVCCQLDLRQISILFH